MNETCVYDFFCANKKVFALKKKRVKEKYFAKETLTKRDGGRASQKKEKRKKTIKIAQNLQSLFFGPFHGEKERIQTRCWPIHVSLFIVVRRFKKLSRVAHKPTEKEWTEITCWLFFCIRNIYGFYGFFNRGILCAEKGKMLELASKMHCAVLEFMALGPNAKLLGQH